MRVDRTEPDDPGPVDDGPEPDRRPEWTEWTERAIRLAPVISAIAAALGAIATIVQALVR